MGVRERKREKTKEKEETRESEIQTPTEVEQKTIAAETEVAESLHTPDVVVEKLGQETTFEAEVEGFTEATPIAIETELVAPPWGTIDESEWMYGIPPRQSDLSLWAEEWGDYLLQWAEARSVHVLSVATFITEPPFKDMRNKVDAFRIISDGLIEKRVAEWVDKNERQLRVYWRPLEDWADDIYAWCLDTGKLRLDVKSIVIQESEQAFSRLPEEDLYKVLAIMVSRGLAEWVDKKKGAVVVES